MTEYIAKCNEVKGIGGKTILVPDYIDTTREIVRCRDCKWYMAYWQSAYCDYMAHSVEPDDFCSYGERRCDENNA